MANSKRKSDITENLKKTKARLEALNSPSLNSNKILSIGVAPRDESPDERTVRTHTADISWYKHVPFLFLRRAHAYYKLEEFILAIGDCIKAIRLCELASGKAVPGQHVVQIRHILEANASYVPRNLSQNGPDYELATDFTKIAEESGLLLMIAAMSLPANPDSVKLVLKPVMEIVPDFETSHYQPWYDRYMAEGMVVMSDEVREMLKRLKEMGPQYTAMIEHTNSKYNNIELSREFMGLERVSQHLRTSVDPRLIVWPQKSTMIGHDRELKAGEGFEVGMIAQTEIPRNGQISHDHTNIVVQDTGNTEAPYRCERCWKTVWQYTPTTGLVCCWHAEKKKKEKQLDVYAPTVYCSAQCQFEHRNLHRKFHRAIITSAYEAAAAGNDFPLFVATIVSPLSPQQHPLTVGPIKSTLEQFGPRTRRVFSMTDDLIAPWNTLLDLRFDIFSDRRFETWVLLSMKHKWERNKRIKGNIKLMFPIRPFYNHSCDSNALCGYAVRKGVSNVAGDFQVNSEKVYAKRIIQKGEEVTINYLGSGAKNMKKAARVNALKSLGIDFCECNLCTKERRELEEKEKKKKEKKGWFG